MADGDGVGPGGEPVGPAEAAGLGGVGPSAGGGATAPVVVVTPTVPALFRSATFGSTQLRRGGVVSGGGTRCMTTTATTTRGGS